MTSLKQYDALADEIADMSEEEFKKRIKDPEKKFEEWINRFINDVHYSRVFSQIKDRRLLFQAVQRRIRDIESHRTNHFYVKEFLIGLAVGAVAMLMITRAVL